MSKHPGERYDDFGVDRGDADDMSSFIGEDELRIDFDAFSIELRRESFVIYGERGEYIELDNDDVTRLREALDRVDDSAALRGEEPRT